MREKRAQTRGNVLAQNRTELYAREYSRHQATGMNHWLDKPIEHKSEARQNTESVIARYLRDGVYAPPEGFELETDADEQNRALT